MSFDIRDLAVYPDTSRVAEGMQSIWQRTSWGRDTPLDGVLMVDPVFLQELVKINGNITLSDGRVLAGGNTAEFLLNKVTFAVHSFSYITSKAIVSKLVRFDPIFVK